MREDERKRVRAGAGTTHHIFLPIFWSQELRRDAKRGDEHPLLSTWVWMVEPSTCSDGLVDSLRGARHSRVRMQGMMRIPVGRRGLGRTHRHHVGME